MYGVLLWAKYHDMRWLYFVSWRNTVFFLCKGMGKNNASAFFRAAMHCSV